MKLFDPDKWRKTIKGEFFAIARTECAEEYLPNSVGNAACLGLQACVYACLVGLKCEAEPLIAKYRAWLEDAIARNEDFGNPPDYFAALRLEALSLAIWLSENHLERALHVKALPLYEKIWKKVGGHQGLNQQEMRLHYAADFLRNCAMGNEFDYGVVFGKSIQKVVPAKAEDIKDEVELGYWLCRRRWGTEEADSATLTAAAQILSLRLQEDWLGRGDSLRAAEWLQLIYWQGGIVHSPEAALLKAYTLMPRIVPPHYLNISRRKLDGLGQ
jgi:hypothetical protein